MDEGYIHSSKTGIRWTPKNMTPGWRYNHPKSCEILLFKVDFFNGSKVKVFRCSACQTEIIDEITCNNRF